MPSPAHPVAPPPAVTGMDQLATRIREHDLRWIRLQYSDVFGSAWNVEVPVSRLDAVMAGEVRFHGTATEGFVRPEQTDLCLAPDPATFRVLPWDEERGPVGLLVCDVRRREGADFEGDPRAALKRVLAGLAEEGLEATVAVECEFLLLEADAQVGEEARRDIVAGLERMGIGVDASHPESAPHQHEVDLLPVDALTAADQVTMLRLVADRVARARGLRASFIPKLDASRNGSGMHLHLGIRAGGVNSFHDPEARDGISDALRHFVGGLLRHARGYCAVTNPLVNSYKRLVPGHEAPVAAAWSLHNRAPLVRIPSPRGPDTRCECLLPDPAANPYLALAALLASGAAGMREELNPGDPLNKNLDSLAPRERQRLRIESLPRDLAEALDHLETDRVVRQALGEHIFSHYMAAKRQEWEEHASTVHPWEIERYL